MTWRAIQTALALLLGLLLANGATGQDRPSVSSAQLVHEQRAREAYRAILDHQMQSEGREQDWALGVERSLRTALTKARSTDLRIRELGCASTLCRVVLNHDSLRSQERVLVSTTGTSGFDLPGLAHLEWDGRGRNVVTYIYLLRRGANWPSAPHRDNAE